MAFSENQSQWGKLGHWVESGC